MKRTISHKISIGRLAELSKLSTATLRYYEKLGLIQSQSRLSRGTRQFAPGARKTLKAIGLFQEMGFTLREVLDLQRLPQSHPAHQQRFRRLLMKKSLEQEQILKEAAKRKRALSKSLKACKPNADICHCDLGLLLGLKGN
jgi:DNA-binding transcriptional MerR regulator